MQDIGATIVPSSSLAGFRSGDRFAYVFMAALFVATAVAGFAPTSLRVIDAVAAGKIPPPYPALHFHAVSMAAWLALMLLQSSLVANGRRALHRKLGLASLVVAPAVIVSLVLLPIIWIVRTMHATDAELAAFQVDIDGGWRLLATQIRAIFLFPLFVGWALLARRTDPETHKRMMILATVVPLNAALSRMVGFSGWLPGDGLSETHLVPDLYQALLLAPVLVYDVVHRGRVHRAYVIGLFLLLSTMLASHFVCGSAWWMTLGHEVLRGSA